jgi:hypothetical protein
MPLTNKGESILSGMEKEYGAKKGEEVFYASRNKGTISGVDAFNKVADMTSDDWKELRDKLAKFFKEEAREPEHKEDAAKDPLVGKRVKINYPGVAGHGKTGKVLGRSGNHLQIESGPDEHRNYMIPEKACKVVGDSDDIPDKIDAILKRMDAK